MVIFSGHLLITILAYVLSQIIQPCFDCAKRLKLVLCRTLFLSSAPFCSPSFKLALVFLFFNIFMFFNQNFLSGNIKTNKITVDTSDVIDTFSKLMRTEKTMIVNYEDDSSLKAAPAHSFLGRLAKKRRFVLKPSTTDEDRLVLIKKRMDYYFFMAVDVDLYFVMSVLASYSDASGLVAFIRAQIYRESFLRAFYLRRNLDPVKKRFIHKR